MRPRTIQIYLPSGDPRGLRVAELTTSIVRVIEAPRKLLPEFLAMSEARQVGLYMLVGDDQDEGLTSVYIGQTGNVGQRLVEHNKLRDFWSRALVMVSLTDSLTQTHGLYLEWLSLQEAASAGRYKLENGNTGSKPHTPAPLEADCLDIFETMRTLVTTLGQPVFEKVLRAETADATREMLFCKGSGADGRGYYTEEGFVVLAGSTGRRESVPSVKKTREGHLRQRLIDAGVLRVDGERVILDKDHLFGSPSMAALALMGRSSNGWLDWKNNEGKTLHALKRANFSAAQT
jgi:hypothetical protein